MDNNGYTLRYLPLFFNDVNNVTSYITNDLSNPKAAHDLLDAIESAVLERLPVCESFEPYHSVKERKYPYYRIYVKNYVIYYVVIDDETDKKIMEVRRLLYNRQKWKNII
ncbi:MAG: type II toxin-antitoxin system RelE/ParE family toxin [Lachnospira sp.]